MIRKIIVLCLCLFTITAHANDCVVLIHGMNRSPFSMRSIASYLGKHGYDVVNKHYPTNTLSVAEVSQRYVTNFIRECQEKNPTRIHVVTHSIGGLLIRQYLKTHELPKGSRIVMLSPPNHGSVMADRLQHNSVYRTTMGPMGQELRTGNGGITKTLPEYFPYKIGIISGNVNLNALSLGAFKSRSDGKVSIKSAKLKGMSDFLEVRSTHTFITVRPDVIAQIGYFLTNGQFKKTH